ncbi:MAG: TlpA disulfide reductase family protein [Thermodesulfovibrionia bacterium]
MGSNPTAGTILISSLLLITILWTNIYAEIPSPFEIDGLEGNIAPEFTIEDMNGKMVSISMFKGHPVLLNVWATWCPYCREEMPELNRLYKRYNSSGLVVIAVSIDKNKEKVKRYLEDIPADYIVLIDTENVVSRLYRVYALPTSILIGRDGKVKKVVLGSRKWDSKENREMIEGILKE